MSEGETNNIEKKNGRGRPRAMIWNFFIKVQIKVMVTGLLFVLLAIQHGNEGKPLQ